jgi:hypothetical protein
VSAHVIEEQLAVYVVWECNGCGDTASSSFDGCWHDWARVEVQGSAYHFCSCSCLWAWNNTNVLWGDEYGYRPGDPPGEDMPF